MLRLQHIDMFVFVCVAHFVSARFLGRSSYFKRDLYSIYYLLSPKWGGKKQRRRRRWWWRKNDTHTLFLSNKHTNIYRIRIQAKKKETESPEKAAPPVKYMTKQEIEIERQRERNRFIQIGKYADWISTTVFLSLTFIRIYYTLYTYSILHVHTCLYICNLDDIHNAFPCSKR